MTADSAAVTDLDASSPVQANSVRAASPDAAGAGAGPSATMIHPDATAR